MSLGSASPVSSTAQPINPRQGFMDKTSRNRLHYFAMLVQTVLLRPVTSSVILAYRVVKLLTWVPLKACIKLLSGYHNEASAFMERHYLKTLKKVRDIALTPSIARQAYRDLMATHAVFVDDITPVPSSAYLNVTFNRSIQQYSSYLHGFGSFDVIKPEGITEFAATTDAELKTIMASHLFKPGMMAINFGVPNVATFITEKQADGSVQTIKVDAKSLKREEMSFHATNGKMQSGIFFVPTNLPEGALERFKSAATEMEGRKDVTCVNTNCRVLEKAGFSIEGVNMDEVTFPNTLMEHFLFRNVFYTDAEGVKHKVHFDIVKTTNQSLQEYFEAVDTAVVGTPLRHRRRKADTPANQNARGVAAKALIAEEAERLAEVKLDQSSEEVSLERRQVTVSVPSYLGEKVSKIWGRHTMYEVDLSDRQAEITARYKKLAEESGAGESYKLSPFPQEKPGLGTRLKRDLFFSNPMIQFMRRHMMGSADSIYPPTQDLFKYLRSFKGERLNYVLLENKIVIAKVHPSGTNNKIYKRIADWALCKHALIAGREEIYCSGEMWYDEAKNRFVVNDDSGTYKPGPARVKLFAELANSFFNDHNQTCFEAVVTEAQEEKK